MFAVSEGQIKTACHGESVVHKRNINSGVVSHDAEVRVLLDNGDSNLVRYARMYPIYGSVNISRKNIRYAHIVW